MHTQRKPHSQKVKFLNALNEQHESPPSVAIVEASENRQHDRVSSMFYYTRVGLTEHLQMQSLQQELQDQQGSAPAYQRLTEPPTLRGMRLHRRHM
jgi:hypothetical protein